MEAMPAGGFVPSLLVTDIPTTVRFYTDILGFRPTGWYPDPDAPVWAELTRGDAILQVFDDPPQGLPATPVLSGTLYIPVADLDPVLRQIGGQVPLEWGPEVMDYGMREVAVRDPDGYLIAFTATA